MKKLTILQSITPDYRKLFFERLDAKLGQNFNLIAGNSYFEKSLKDDVTIKKTKVKNIFIFNKLMIQKSVLKLSFTKGILVLELNPRILTNWIILFFRNILGKETVLWGHAWPRNGKNVKSEKIRMLMKKLSTSLIVYTERQKIELKENLPNKIIYSAPNAVIPILLMSTNQQSNRINNFIYVGRLTELKKPFLIVKAFHKALRSLPSKCNLFILGDGDEFDKLESYISQNSLQSRIFLKGHVSDYECLKKMYSSSLFSISSGYVGLSIIQSFSFGVPMLVSKNENHSPEIEALILEKNGLFFETNSINSLSEKMVTVFKNKNEWIHKRQSIVDFCKKKYSIESMTDTFIKLVQ